MRPFFHFFYLNHVSSFYLVMFSLLMLIPHWLLALQLCILVAGALGGRFDHEIGNINVLFHFSNIRIVLVSDDCLIHLLPRTHHHEIHILSSIEGPHCGLIPIGMPSAKTTTTGLQWDLSEYIYFLPDIIVVVGAQLF